MKTEEIHQALAHASSDVAPFPGGRAVAETAQPRTFEEVYRQTFPRVYAFLRAHVRTREAAEDLVSRVFEKAIRHQDRTPEGDAAIHWIFRIAKNTLIDYWRVEGRRARVQVDIEELESTPSRGLNPEGAFAALERQQLLLQVMGDLEEKDRLILSLKFSGQRTNREISKILDMKEGAVSMRLLRALRSLRQRLSDMGVR